MKITKKLDKVNNSYEYLAYKSWIIWNQNTKVMAKKQISMQNVMQNSTSVSYNHPLVEYISIAKPTLKFEHSLKLWNFISFMLWFVSQNASKQSLLTLPHWGYPMVLKMQLRDIQFGKFHHNIQNK